jgi:predicted DNA-binding transcriptional regulator YafY
LAVAKTQNKTTMTDSTTELQKILRALRLMATLRSRPQTFAQIQEILEDDGAGSRRSVYRYINLFRALNLNIQKKGKCYFIDDPKGKDILLGHGLKDEEFALIRKSLLQVAPNHPMLPNILKKLTTASDFLPLLDTIVKQQILDNINQLDTAIQSGVCVALKGYQPLKGNRLSKRIVEPKRFMKNHQQVYCYDIYIKDMRLFSIDRIEQVELLPDTQTHDEIPQTIDVFGYVGKDMRQAVLRLSLNAYLLLKEELPLSEEYLKEDGGDKFLFTGFYAHFDGICRFILGLGAKEIEVLQPNDLKVELNRRITEGGMF